MVPDELARCEHGKPKHSGMLLSFNGPIGFCQCCENHFGYIDRGSWSTDGVSEYVTHNSRLCPGCGGTPRVERYERPSTT